MHAVEKQCEHKSWVPACDARRHAFESHLADTGFTEGQLKGDKQMTQQDVEDMKFGMERETDDAVTTVFVLLLIATPFIVGAIGFSLGVFVVPSFVKF